MRRSLGYFWTPDKLLWACGLLCLAALATWPTGTSAAGASAAELPAAVEPGPVDGSVLAAPAPLEAMPPWRPPATSRPLPFTASPFNAPRGEPWLAGEPWTLQTMPQGIIYRSYLAGKKEPRFALVTAYERHWGWLWDVSLGGRLGLLRYGNTDPVRPEGWQLDIEGAGQPRLDLENKNDVLATDFRFGVPLTFGMGNYQTKFGYYHISSHLGDEFMLRYPEFERINYSRDALVWGHSYFVTEDVRLYAEAAWAFYSGGPSEPWDLQFGVDYSPTAPTGFRGSPFVAVNGQMREELRFGGNLVVQTGWQWRGYSGHLLRMGMEYYNGKSDQYEFYNQFEEKVGMGVWCDF